MPKTGPTDASRRQSTGRLPMWPRPCVSETEVVVFPSPAFVGVIAVTQINLPSGAPRRRSSTEKSIFAFVRPYGSTSSGSRPASEAISSIGRSVAACAISRLDGSAVVIRRTLMLCDGAEMALVRTGRDDLADLRDHVPKLVVGGVVVRP